MEQSKKKIVAMTEAIQTEDYATANQLLQDVMFEKVQKRCTDAYNKIKNSSKKNK